MGNVMRKLRMDMSPSVSLHEVVISSTLVLVLRSKLLAQVSSVRRVEC